MVTGNGTVLLVDETRVAVVLVEEEVEMQDVPVESAGRAPSSAARLCRRINVEERRSR